MVRYVAIINKHFMAKADDEVCKDYFYRIELKQSGLDKVIDEWRPRDNTLNSKMLLFIVGRSHFMCNCVSNFFLHLDGAYNSFQKRIHCIVLPHT